MRTPRHPSQQPEQWHPLLDPVEDAFARHERVALQFSGGRDSLATLHLLRPYWGRMTVYYCNAGDALPETLAAVERVRAAVPHFAAIEGRLAAVRRTLGFASDVVPTQCGSWLGRAVSGRTVRLVDRYTCCVESLMRPMHERMAADGVTLLIRGQRDDEYAAPPLRSGGVSEGFEVLYPIQHWSAAEVDAFLARIGETPPPYYGEGLTSAPECLSCTAWLDERRGAYLARHHPQAFAEYVARLRDIRECVAPVMELIDAEVSLGEHHGIR